MLEEIGRTNRVRTFRDILMGENRNENENNQREEEHHQTISQPIILTSSHLQLVEPPQITFSEEYLKQLASRWERAIIIRTGQVFSRDRDPSKKTSQTMEDQ